MLDKCWSRREWEPADRDVQFEGFTVHVNVCETRAWKSSPMGSTLPRGLAGCLDLTPPPLRGYPEALLWLLGSIKGTKDMLTER